MSNSNRVRTSVSTIANAQSTSSVLSEAITLADAGNPERALQLLKSEGKSTDAVINARSVCLMRLGRGEDARKALRTTVMQSECTWLKPDVPVIYRTNFCMALLLSGHPQGCLSLLTDIKEQNHPSAQRVQQALDAWKRGLTFWQRLQCNVGIEPEVQFVPDFVPGDFVEPLSTPGPVVSTQNSTDRPVRQAV
jgi:Flp pilus assembly protein TadD